MATSKIGKNLILMSARFQSLCSRPHRVSCLVQIGSAKPLSSTSFKFSTKKRDDDPEFKAYEIKSGQEPDHFKKTLDIEKEGLASAQQEGKTKEVLVAASEKNKDEFTLPHPIWSDSEVDSVQITHRKPESFSDKMAYWSVMTLRTTFDLASGYTVGKQLETLDERAVLTRCIFLETVAGKKI